MADLARELGARGGFEFDLCGRNKLLERIGMKMPKATSTGTTIVGLIYNGGVVLGADTRATNDTTVADKNCEKIHYIAPNIYCCGAGTAADTENTTNMISSQLALHRLESGRESRVITSLTFLKRYLFRYQGNVSAALVLGGVDSTGPHLYTIYPHGSTDDLPYVTMGSGSLAAMAVFEAHWKKDMDEASAVQLVHDAIASGIFNDLGSGSNVDVTIIRNDRSVEVLRNMDKPNERLYRRRRPHDLARGTTAVLSEKRVPVRARVDVFDGDLFGMPAGGGGAGAAAGAGSAGAAAMDE